MEFNQADQYYLKAIDFYPFDFEFVLENLQYALSHDDEHVQSWCLKGQIFMYHIKEYEEAKMCFTRALQANIYYPDAYKHLSKLYIWLGEYEQASKLIRFGKSVRGIDRSELLRNEALMHECKGDFKTAKIMLKRAQLLVVSTPGRTMMKQDIERLKEKIKVLKLEKKKRKKSRKTRKS